MFDMVLVGPQQPRRFAEADAEGGRKGASPSATWGWLLGYWLPDPCEIPVLAPLIKREILWRLIVGEQGSAVRQLGLADSHLSHISRAVRWIREHYARSFKVEEIADFVGMSASAFYRNFQAVTAMSPIQFQKQIRLQEARLLLATHPNDVTGVGFKVGYDSASQFSREYRRHFGTAPSQDAANMRIKP